MRGLLLAPLCALLAAPGWAADCGRVLVSGYQSNIHVYDACDGSFQQVLDQDTPRKLAGAQASRVHDGMLYVVSEGTQQILRYRADSLAFVDVFIETGPINPTGVDIGPDGDVYVGGYESDSVLRFDGQSGSAKGVVVAARAAGLNGPDNGLVFGPDGRLYVPGYDSNSVVRYDPNNGQTSTFIAGGSGGLRHTRAILFEPGGQTLLVASEGSNAVLRYRASDGSFVGRVSDAVSRPTGLAYGENGELLVSLDGADTVRVLNPSNGAFVRDLFPANSGGLSRSTFVTYLPKAEPAPVQAAHIGSQFWIVGPAVKTNRVLSVDDAVSATGGAFGAGFDPTAVNQRRWGRLQIEWTGCDAAVLSWESGSGDAAGFGSGGYPLQRLLPNAASRDCAERGFESIDDGRYMSGTWYGGPSRDGEGLFIDSVDDSLALVAFFTHRPAGF